MMVEWYSVYLSSAPSNGASGRRRIPFYKHFTPIGVKIPLW